MAESVPRPCQEAKSSALLRKVSVHGGGLKVCVCIRDGEGGVNCFDLKALESLLLTRRLRFGERFPKISIFPLYHPSCVNVGQL